MKEKRIFLDDKKNKEEVTAFLGKQNIRLDKNLEYTIGIYDEEELIATGSIFKNTLRCIAVKTEYQGTNVLNKLISHLVNEQYQRGNTHIFIYTKPEAAKSFSHLGFYEIERTKDVVLMENEGCGIKDYLKNLHRTELKHRNIACIVMNANPFTKGHQYLIEQASKENDVVHVFVVSEEASVIPFSVRYELVKRGTQHLDNIVLQNAGQYIISSTTFPSYFIKDEGSVVDIHARLDLNIFANYIAKELNINRRYVGDEPKCEVTNSYNEMMKKVLTDKGIECKVIHRRKCGGKVISASYVRQAIKDNRFETIRKLIPETTYDFFVSQEGQTLIKKIQENTGRH